MGNEELEKIRRSRIWLWCIIIIMAFFIIIQFSLEHCGNPKLAELFTFASTISSIILSVIAIIMTVVSGESVNNLLHKFRDLHGEIKDEPQKINTSVGEMIAAAKELKTSMGTVNSTVVAIDSSVSGMSNASASLNHAVEQLKELVQGIDGNVVELNSKVSNISLKMEEGLVGNVASQTDPKLMGDISKILPSYLSRSSYYGICMLYCIFMAKNEGKLLDLRGLSKVIDSTYDYIYGYFISCSALNLFIYEKIENRYFEIRGLVDGLDELLLKAYKKKAESGKFSKDYTEDIVAFIETSPSIDTDPSLLKNGESK